MAKKGRSSAGVNKAQLIRDALKELGLDAPAKDVQAYAQKNGATVAPAQVSNIRTKMKGGKKPGRRGRKPGSTKAAAAAAGVGAPITGSDLIQARIMADKVGGVPRAKELLDILNKLR